MLTVTEILADLAACGLTFVYDAVQTGGRGDKGKSLGEAPVLTIVDTDKFLSTFGDHGRAVILAALDGQSLRVQSQRVCRDELSDRPTTERSVLERMLIERLILKQRAARTATVVKTTVFAGMDGVEYPTLTEMGAANIAVLVDSGVPVAVAQNIVNEQIAKLSK